MTSNILLTESDEDGGISLLQHDNEIIENLAKVGQIVTKVAFHPNAHHLRNSNRNKGQNVDREWMWVEVLEGGRNEGVGKTMNEPLYPRYSPSSKLYKPENLGIPVPYKTEIYYRHNKFICRLRDMPWAKEAFEDESDKVGCKPLPGTFSSDERRRIMEHLRKIHREDEVTL